ncbi:hypothetical protein O3Q52_18040 [Streptomyces sp. ActVer]|uniref:hypothetical protein n=1 Tax=Streptomyces sp. ActVer TaxID=3014558 RepID=UPI0022B4F8E2|nr:hypothetical protein [Streptomyces sp. ActVer]MCZ4510057.1 hypothetical protein [Streptomyces sp. ActVer]
MSDPEKNKVTAQALYAPMFNQCRPAEHPLYDLHTHHPSGVSPQHAHSDGRPHAARRLCVRCGSPCTICEP